MIRWTVITVTYNSASTLLAHWVDSIPDGVEWIVVDNCSTDNSVGVARALGATVIEMDSNRGFAAANNVGLQRSSGSCVAFVNPDVAVDFQTLFLVESDVSAGRCLVAPQLLNADGSTQPNARGGPVLLRKIANRLGRASRLEGTYLLTVAPFEKRYAWWITGAVVFASVSFIRELGGWDERFFLYHEDADLSLRAWRAGGVVYVDGRFRWRHSWARESKSFRLRPIMHELSSAFKFYSREPMLLLSDGTKRYSPQNNRSGQKLSEESAVESIDCQEERPQ